MTRSHWKLSQFHFSPCFQLCTIWMDGFHRNASTKTSWSTLRSLKKSHLSHKVLPTLCIRAWPPTQCIEYSSVALQRVQMYQNLHVTHRTVPRSWQWPPPECLSFEWAISRVHKNKSMQHHTLGSGTAEFQVTWPPKLREGTYLVKNVRARFEYRKTIAAHEKQVIMQEKAQPCASLWRKTLRPKRVRFLAIDAPIVDYVCLPLYHLTFLGSYQPLCEFSWRKKKEKAR